MDSVNIRQLRNKGGEVIDRVDGGEALLVTRDGRPVAELRPVRPRGLARNLVVQRARNLPAVDPAVLRTDLDAAVDPGISWQA